MYRQSTEALTKHRMALVEATKPPGYEEWAARTAKRIADDPEKFSAVSSSRVDGSHTWQVDRDGKKFLIRHQPPEVDMREQEWDGEINEGPELEGPRGEEERRDQVLLATRKPLENDGHVEWEDEPLLTADQYVDYRCGASSRAVWVPLS